MKHKSEEIEEENILDLIEDVVAYFKKDEEDLELIQQHIGMREIFRGFIVKDWRSPNFNCNKHTTLNRIVVKRSMLFHIKCWKHRNERHYDKGKQR